MMATTLPVTLTMLKKAGSMAQYLNGKATRLAVNEGGDGRLYITNSYALGPITETNPLGQLFAAYNIIKPEPGYYIAYTGITPEDSGAEPPSLKYLIEGAKKDNPIERTLLAGKPAFVERKEPRRAARRLRGRAARARTAGTHQRLHRRRACCLDLGRAGQAARCVGLRGKDSRADCSDVAAMMATVPGHYRARPCSERRCPRPLYLEGRCKLHRDRHDYQLLVRLGLPDWRHLEAYKARRAAAKHLRQLAKTGQPC